MIENTNNGGNRLSRGIYLLPSLLTIVAMFSGFFSLIESAKGNYLLASVAILFACLFDFLDGRVARMTSTQTDFGAQLDSLSDLISFGLAPALLLYYWSFSSLGRLGWTVAFAYCVCAALRLARFNSASQNANKTYFIGLASPIPAVLIASGVWFCLKYSIPADHYPYMQLSLSILLSFLMIANVKFKSFKDFNAAKKVPFTIVIVALVVFLLVALSPALTIFLLLSIYILLSLVLAFVRFLSERKGGSKESGS
jgi:CDP-diacylglycerol---serine O-phosphatidyltransferase